MPIRPENRSRYPEDWPAISLRVREEAGQRCECMGECGSVRHQLHFHPRCPARNGRLNPLTGSKVILTVAHLDHTPENVERANLKAMCQLCHLSYDRDHHAETRRASRRDPEQALLW